MTSTFNFASRPFRDERPLFLVIGAMLIVSAVLLVVNVRLYVGYQRSVAGTSQQVADLEKRRAEALRRGQEARAALESYRASNLAAESKSLLKIIEERRFSWTALLGRLERVLPADVRVSSLAPRFDNQGASIGLGLVGKDGESVVHTIAALAHDPVFSVIDLKSEATPEHRGVEDRGAPDGQTFLVDVRYHPPVPRSREK